MFNKFILPYFKDTNSLYKQPSKRPFCRLLRLPFAPCRVDCFCLCTYVLIGHFVVALALDLAPALVLARHCSSAMGYPSATPHHRTATHSRSPSAATQYYLY